MPVCLQDERMARAFVADEHAVRLRAAKVAFILCLVLMPFGSLLDWFVYGRDQCLQLFKIRVVSDVAIAGLMALFWTEIGRRFIRGLTWLAAATPIVAMCWMIYSWDGVASPYYAGLNLVTIGLCLLLPYEVGEALLYCLFVVAAYLTAALCSPSTDFSATDFWRNLFNNMYFLLLTCFIGVLACHLNRRRRIAEFVARYTLDVRNRQLTELDALKSRFFANVSHELRTPLTLILAPVEELYRQRGQLPVQYAQTLPLIRDNGLRLLGLINDLLDIARLDEGQREPERRLVRLDELVPGIVESARPLATAKGLRLSLDLPAERLLVHGDAPRLEKVFLNLVANAIKFTRAGGSVAVRCQRAGDEVEVAVTDTGIGIPAEELPRVFDRFHQVGGVDYEHHPGTGLGLALVKELTEAHGGRLAVTSEIGRGSTFVVWLPLAPAAPAEAAGPPSAPVVERTPEDSDVLAGMFRAARFAGLTAGPARERTGPVGRGGRLILVVDDEPGMLTFLVRTLAAEHTVLAASDGPTALQLAAEHRPQLVVLDLMLPGIDGLEVCRRLRSQGIHPDLKVLMLTARMEEETKIEALESGADDFLTKPFSIIEVKTRTRNLLAASTLQQDLRERNRDLEATLAQLRTTEAQLIQSERMSALGSLAAGLLHEINNPLNYMRMAVTLAKRGAPAGDEKLAKRLQDIEAGIQRIGDIVSGLREFAHPETNWQPQPFSMHEAVQTALRFTAHALRDVQVRWPEAETEVQVLGSRNYVIQVLVNLLSNAAQAVEPVRDQRPAEVRLATEPRDGRLYVRVWDNGEGIDETVMPRIFDPFFTTREVGQGTGLGLSICYTLVQKHGGAIHVRSRKGEWTEFEFDVPLCA